MNEIYLLDVIKRLDEKQILKEDTLSRFLIELDKRGLTLTPIIADIQGLTTPRLSYNIDDYIIYRILDKSSPLRVTEEGKKYIEDKVMKIQESPDYKKFVEIVDSILPSFL